MKENLNQTRRMDREIHIMVFIITVVLILGSINQVEIGKELEAQTVLKNQNYIEKEAEKVNNVFTKERATMREFMENMVIRDEFTNKTITEGLILEADLRGNGSTYFFTFKDGFHVHSRGHEYGYKPKGEDWYQHSVESLEGFYISEPYLNEDEEYQVTMVEPFNSKSNRTAIVGVNIPLRKIIGSVEDIQLGENSFAFLLDSSGTIVSHPNPEYKLKDIGEHTNAYQISQVGGNVSLEEQLTMKARSVKDYDGEMRYLCIGDITETGWKLGASIKPSKSGKFGGVTFFTIAIILIGIAFFFLRHSTSKDHTIINKDELNK